MSSQFIVAPAGTEEFLQAQNGIGHRDEYSRWRLGVGIGVGLGTPLLMAVTAVCTWLFLKKKLAAQPNPHSKPIVMAPLGRE